MLREAFEWLAEHAASVKYERFDDLVYSHQALKPIPEPMPAAVDVTTLTGFVRFVVEARNLNEPCIITVDDPEHVSLRLGSLTTYKNRPVYCRARAVLPELRLLNRFVGREEFQISVMSLFVDTPARKELLAMISGIVAGETRTANDDGLSQEVVVRKAVSATKERVTVRSEYKLAPYRTFSELDQPESSFIVRLRDDGEIVNVGLFECDGGRWRVDAIDTIADFLRTALGPGAPEPVLA